MLSIVIGLLIVLGVAGFVIYAVAVPHVREGIAELDQTQSEQEDEESGTISR